MLRARAVGLGKDNRATQRRIAFLKLEEEALRERVEALEAEECEFRARRAQLQQSLGLLEAKSRELEARGRQRLLAKFAGGVAKGAVGALFVLKLGGVLVRRVV